MLSNSAAEKNDAAKSSKDSYLEDDQGKCCLERINMVNRVNGKIKDIYKLKIPFAEIVDARDEEYAQSLVVVDKDSNSINGIMTIISADMKTRRFLFFKVKRTDAYTSLYLKLGICTKVYISH
nr:hypothetical protein [Tanacetum cinerariifolium]